MSGTFRYVHPRKNWFVDLPLQAKPFFTSKRSPAIVIARDTEEKIHDVSKQFIEMHGIVVKRQGSWVTVSCDGLFVSAPCDTNEIATGSEVSVVIS